MMAAMALPTPLFWLARAITLVMWLSSFADFFLIALLRRKNGAAYRGVDSSAMI